MKIQVFTKIAVVASSILLMSACSWVDLSDAGTQVLVRTHDQARDCEKLGSTSASVKSNIWFYDRKPQKMATELQTLARNEAAKMGGNTIVIDSAITGGAQRFRVYKCH